MENILYYALHENKMTDDPDDYYAVPAYTGSVTEDDLIEEMTSSGSTLTKGEAKLFFQQFKQAIHKKMVAGYTVNTGLFNIAPRVIGVFKNKNDRYDPARHAVSIKVSPGVDLKEVEGKFTLSITETTKLLPVLADFKDIASALMDQLVTIGGAGQITGHRLAIDTTDANQGIFFVGDNGQSTKAETIIRNKPSELIFMIPATLTAGNYYLEVRNIPKGSKDIRTGRLDAQLAAR
jgi:hypothetical protein